ncbi:hypothetical protein [Prosthecobacter sp.]|uniref:hypothetical protein n=1 Tax=Prosthecobacter sp. TaxID=1965333 RepID=UPI001DCB89DF|nr:hypothetical protein [Prosthecobacter sp.]MCB1277539.1 hypothetical protein [Prosthecobacter sp.]
MRITRQTALFLILIGAVLRLRGCAIFGGSMAATPFGAGDSEEVAMKKLELVAESMKEASQSWDLSWWFLGAGVALLFRSLFWQKANQARHGLKSLERRHAKSRRRR